MPTCTQNRHVQRNSGFRGAIPGHQLAGSPTHNRNLRARQSSVGLARPLRRPAPSACSPVACGPPQCLAKPLLPDADTIPPPSLHRSCCGSGRGQSVREVWLSQSRVLLLQPRSPSVRWPPGGHDGPARVGWGDGPEPAPAALALTPVGPRDGRGQTGGASFRCWGEGRQWPMDSLYVKLSVRTPNAS